MKRWIPLLMIAAGVGCTLVAVVSLRQRQSRLEALRDEVDHYADRVLPAAQVVSTTTAYANHEIITAAENLTIWTDQLQDECDRMRRDWFLLCTGQVGFIGGVALARERRKTPATTG